jgi:hypothetical protein
MKTKDGGAAFPVLDSRTDYEGENPRLECVEGGMTLRDWFAGQALAGYSDISDIQVAAKWCYEMADAMIGQKENQ